MGEKLAEQNSLTLDSVADTNQGEVALVGRIVCDSMGKLCQKRACLPPSRANIKAFGVGILIGLCKKQDKTGISR